MKRKLIAVLVAAFMVATAGCKLSVDWTDKEKAPVKTEMQVGDIVMPTGELLIKDFDAITITKFLAATREVKDYHIIINTGGGQAGNAVTMLNWIEYLQSKGAVITTEIIGYGYSAGSYLFLAGDNRIVHRGATLMFHGAGVRAYGIRYGCKSEFPDTAPAGMQDMICLLDENFKTVLRKSNLSEEDIEHWMYSSDANFMTAEEAFELGIATEIIGD